MEVGINLYSIRNYLNTESEVLDSLIKLKEMGYSFVQFSGCPLNSESIRKVSKESNIPVVLTHMPYDRIINDVERLMEEHESFNCHNIGLGMLKTDYSDEKTVKEMIASLEKAAEKMSKNGFKFFYHNHCYEFVKYDNQTLFDYMLENAPHFNFTLDTYWVQNGGVDLCDFLLKLKGKIDCVHLKDYSVDKKSLMPVYESVGYGNMNFNKIIPIMKDCGTKYFLVEQDNAANLPNTFELVKRSLDYIKTYF